jgi:NAD(P)-dependent dehydrogenase (short-subunit alcohol dehydrogenase family)
VPGASRGIGAATAVALDAAGARVALAGRDLERLRAVAARLSHDPVVLAADLSHVDAPEQLAVAARAGLGSDIDVLVNNAAYAQRLPITEHDAELIDRMHAVNVRAPLLLIRALVPAMIERGRGSIVSVSSVSGVVGTPMRSGYGATKGALDAASRCLARELGGHGIRVNTVAPGVVDTDLWARNKQIPGVIEQINAQTPLGRWATPEDIADVIVFLASDASRFITGRSAPTVACRRPSTSTAATSDNPRASLARASRRSAPERDHGVHLDLRPLRERGDADRNPCRRA